MLSTRLLDSPQEYKQVSGMRRRVRKDGADRICQALLVYAKRIADEGFRGKAEELVKELFGPVYWCASCISISSHDLLIVSIFIGGLAVMMAGARRCLACRSGIC